MNRFKLEAYENEFNFLSRILDRPHPNHLKSGDTERWCRPGERRGLASIRVARLDANVLKSVPTYYGWDGSAVGISKSERVFFVIEGGKIIADAVRRSATRGSNYAHSETRHEDGETVLEAIDRHGCASSLRYIVWTRSGFEIVEHHSTDKWHAIIYKEGKGLKLSAAIEAARAEALEQVRAESDLD